MLALGADKDATQGSLNFKGRVILERPPLQRVQEVGRMRQKVIVAHRHERVRIRELIRARIVRSGQRRHEREAILVYVVGHVRVPGRLRPAQECASSVVSAGARNLRRRDSSREWVSRPTQR